MHNKTIKATLNNLGEALQKEDKQKNISFDQFLQDLAKDPKQILRNAFQLFYDMVHHYVPEGTNEYSSDPESISYIKYDCSKLFVDGFETPFFADRLFANRLIRLTDSLKHGIDRKILVFEGPPGSGKSTFLNNLLQRLEEYTKLEEGFMYETIWRVDIEKLGGMKQAPIEELVERIYQTQKNKGPEQFDSHFQIGLPDKSVDVPCPSHDHPILQVPREFRKQLLEEVILDKDFLERLFSQKEYEWVFKHTPCAICTSLYQTLYDHDDVSPSDILGMLHARRYKFNRKLGNGISIFNPGDELDTQPIRNPMLQSWINTLFRDSNAVAYVYSTLAKTNNGIYAIMDVKSKNKERLKNLHGIISDGVHKVAAHIEEDIQSLFITLLNPEDKEVIDNDKSFQDRVVRINVPYILDYNTEVDIYRNLFGSGIDDKFLPGALESFAKVIVSSRLEEESEAVSYWISDPSEYEDFCDPDLMLLKMEIYTGVIPIWLIEEDRHTLDQKTRRNIIKEGETEGVKGFSGRESLQIFNEFYSKFATMPELIDIEDVVSFFSDVKLKKEIPDDFLTHLENLYDYTALQQVKESMFYYNEEQVSHDIQNYLHAMTCDIGTTIVCPYTKEKIEVTETFFETIENRLLEENTFLEDEDNIADFRNDILNEYVTKTVQDIAGGKDIIETELYNVLLERYNNSLKQNVLDPFVNNDSFRTAIKEYGTDLFNSYDKRIRNEVGLLFKNLQEKFGYSEQGARQVCIYVIDKELVELFSD
tara:strand:+ start:10385 stop:12667 length:2283 start_codon:yes stop_codon:yes gene_type:complete